MDFYFANREALLEWVKQNLKLDAEVEYGYYGEVTFQAKLTSEGTEVLSESASAHVDTHCWSCKCYD